MMRNSLALFLFGLLAAGCTPWLKRPEPPPPAASTAAAQPLPVESAAPAPKLLPHEELNAANAKQQAQLFEDQLRKDDLENK